MEPTVGRIVHYYTSMGSQWSNGVGNGPYPAVVTRVWTPTCINLKVLPDCNEPFDATSIGLKNDSLTTYWEWPPRV